MTPRRILITAIAAAALVVGVPTAFADSWGADQQGDISAMLDARERSQASELQARLGGSVAPDVFERAVAARIVETSTRLGGSVAADVFERAVAARIVETSTPLVGDGGDRFRIDPTSGPDTVATASAGDELEWPQIGFGIVIGVLFALGLMLVLRMTRGRQLAH